jgi:tetratricopeptide (TPR) repeat protein
MICCPWVRRLSAGILLGAGLAGCAPGGDKAKDEQREAHYLQGRKLTGQMDYDGAMDAYEKALQVNPRSASAHFELALLCEAQTHDPAAAVYHYQRFLKICAHNDSRVDQAHDHLNQCLMELVRSASTLVMLPPSAQSSLEKLAQENRDLKARLAQLELANANRPAPVPTNPPPLPPVQQVQATNPLPPTVEPVRAEAPRASPPPPTATASRTYVIKSNDTLAAIARRYSTTIAALQAANPRVEALHLRPGSTLNIPAP